MRTLFEIVESAKDGNMPTHEECLYGMLAYEFLMNMDHRNLREALLSGKELPKILKELKADNSFKTYKSALDSSPKEWLGWDKDPANPDYQAFREMVKAVWDNIKLSREKLERMN